jgi:hypothetical protein
MKIAFAFSLLILSTIISNGKFIQEKLVTDSIQTQNTSVLIIPYQPAMHLSDADADISEGSEMNPRQMREALRMDLMKEMNKKFAEVYNLQQQSGRNFVRGDNNETEALYHSLMFSSDSVYPLKDKKRFAVKDTATGKKTTNKFKPETKYMNVTVQDDALIPDYAKKYNADYIIFLNEIDIKTHSEDCINLALKIYRRDLMVHYSIFDKTGKQVYGDVAVSHFGSNSNDVNQIAAENFPSISDYVLNSMNRIAK